MENINNKNKAWKELKSKMEENHKLINDKIDNVISHIKACYIKSKFPYMFDFYKCDMEMFDELKQILEYFKWPILPITMHMKEDDINRLLNEFNELNEKNIMDGENDDKLFLKLRKLIDECRLILFIAEICEKYKQN